MDPGRSRDELYKASLNGCKMTIYTNRVGFLAFWNGTRRTFEFLNCRAKMVIEGSKMVIEGSVFRITTFLWPFTRTEQPKSPLKVNEWERDRQRERLKVTEGSVVGESKRASGHRRARTVIGSALLDCRTPWLKSTPFESSMKSPRLTFNT